VRVRIAHAVFTTLEGVEPINANLKRGLSRGLAQAAPIVLGYLPIGFAYGVLATNAGLSPRNVVLMSLITYAGASQFVAAGLFAVGAPPTSIILTTFVTNLRHFLMTASLASHLSGWRWPRLALFGYQVTDETFAVHAARFAAGPVRPVEAFCVNACAQIAWVSGSALGVLGGQILPDPRPWGLDYALPALFVALLVLQIPPHGEAAGKGGQARDRTGTKLAVAGLGGASAVLFALLGVGPWGVILATLLGATLGAVLESRGGQAV
jgi:4-azaleucine resistance transporter AzlC